MRESPVTPHVRLKFQDRLARRIIEHPRFVRPAPFDAQVERREWLKDAIVLTEKMAPGVHSLARRAADVFRLAEPIELYQSAGANWLDPDHVNVCIGGSVRPIRIRVLGHVLATLDDATMLAVLGHELGHYCDLVLDPPMGEARRGCHSLLDYRSLDPASSSELMRVFSLTVELTADRYGLLVCRDLDTALRTEMMLTSGLKREAVASWDTGAYLDQARELVEEMLRTHGSVDGLTHPEHSVRAWALWRFSQSDVYYTLTGQGDGACSIEDIDRDIAVLLRVEAALSASADGRSSVRRPEGVPTPSPLPETLAPPTLDTAADPFRDPLEPTLRTVTAGARRLVDGVRDWFGGHHELPEDDGPDVNLDDLGDDLADRFAELERQLERERSGK
ncbi:MAG TPA: hypothetical protein VH877_08900 [Polyangia bacterium]|jgi:hypothetical protein|nr:hypothetical protein [Polyangia bacterium]